MPYPTDLNISSTYFNLPSCGKTQTINALSWVIGRDPLFACDSNSSSRFDPVDLATHLLQQEEQQNSGVGDGVAILHFTSPTICRPFLGIARLEQPTEWESDDGRPIDILGVLLSPCAAVRDTNELDIDRGLHLRTLSRLTRFLLNEEVASALRHASSAQELLKSVKTLTSQDNGHAVSARIAAAA